MNVFWLTINHKCTAQRKEMNSKGKYTLRKGGILMRTRKFFKWLGIVLAGIIILLCFSYLCLPKGPRETMEFDDPYRTERTLAESDHNMASTGTPWATATALKTMKEIRKIHAASLFLLRKKHMLSNRSLKTLAIKWKKLSRGIWVPVKRVRWLCFCIRWWENKMYSVSEVLLFFYVY